MSFNDVRRQFQEMMDRKADVLFTVPGLLGRISDRAVAIPTRPGYVYVRIGHEETEGQARNKRVPNRYDLPVVLGYDGITDEFQVLAIRQETYLAAGFDVVPEIAPHHETHEFPGVGTGDGSDLVYVHHRQIRGLRIYASGTYLVSNEPGHAIVWGYPMWITSQTLDLTSYVPTSGINARFVLIYLDANGDLKARAGNIVSVEAIQIADAPAPTTSEIPLAWVLLYRGQAAISDDRTEQNIYDLRYVNFAKAITAHNIISSAHTDTAGTAAAGDVLTYNGAKWVPSPISFPPAGDNMLTPRWHCDGPLAVADEVDGAWILALDTIVSTVSLYVKTLGTAGSTTVDVEYSDDNGNTWQTIFTNPSNRPALAYNSSDHVTVGIPDVQGLVAGWLLRMNIEQVASGARCADVQLAGQEGENIVSSRLPLNWVD